MAAGGEYSWLAGLTGAGGAGVANALLVHVLPAGGVAGAAAAPALTAALAAAHPGASLVHAAAADGGLGALGDAADGGFDAALLSFGAVGADDHDAAFRTHTSHSGSLLPALAKKLKAGAALGVVVPSGASGGSEAVLRELALSGFVGGAAAAPGVVVARRPTAAATGVARLTRARVPAAVQAASAAADDRGGLGGAAKWATLAATADLVDEDALLAADALPAAGGAPGSKAACPPKRRACANCSCGRKEEEAGVVKVSLADDGDAKPAAAAVAVAAAPVAAAAPPKAAVPAPRTGTTIKPSGCGNCYKGDAFRCGSCPFFGMPAFKPGEEGTILLDMSKADLVL